MIFSVVFIVYLPNHIKVASVKTSIYLLISSSANKLGSKILVSIGSSS